MRTLQDSTTLLEIEKMLEEEITSTNNNIRIISDINLTYEEYKFIKTKLKGLGLYKDNIEVWSQYRLCTLVCWVFSLRYEEKDSNSQAISSLFDGMHQHNTRLLVEIYNDTFEEFGIEIPGVTINNVESLCETIAMHAGVPDELHSKFYAALDDTMTNSHEVKGTEKEFFKKLSPKMKFIIRHVGNDLQRSMLFQYRKVIYDLKVEGLTEDEVLDRNPVASRKIVSSFDKLCRCQEEDAVAI